MLFGGFKVNNEVLDKTKIDKQFRPTDGALSKVGDDRYPREKVSIPK